MTIGHFARLALVSLPLLCSFAPSLSAQARRGGGFRMEEATIAGVHRAFRSRALTCRALVQRYLARIDSIDRRGPAINALVTLNPAALLIADSLDKRYAKDGPVGPLHCVPMIVKDNFETSDLQTTAGSLALKGWIPPPGRDDGRPYTYRGRDRPRQIEHG